ncbi:hypothetical protein MRX96_002182 [Rhipicephalus microplus]
MKLLSAWRPLSSACAQQSRRCYSITTNGEHWLHGYLSDAMVRFRVALRTLWPRGRVAVHRGQGPPVLSRYLQRWAKQTRAADLRRRAARQLFAGARLPLMGLTGVCLITKPSLVTSEEELESVCVALRELAVTMSRKREGGTDARQGSTAAKDLGGEQTQQEASTVKDLAVPVKHMQEFSPAATMKADELHFDLAVKVLFNYYAASNATAIWDSLQKECLPVLVNQLLPKGLWRCRLPPPCPHSGDASGICGLGGCGRNATLYLVMRRYQCSLAEYLQSHVAASRDPRVQLSLLCQLLEAVCHLGQHGVAHRDLKADNLLLDLSKGTASPKLVLSDFGSCLANLHLHFVSPEVNRGGNPALMAPEASC